MSSAGGDKSGPKTIPGMTYDPDTVIAGDTPDEPAPDDNDDADPVDHDNGVLGVEDDDTVGVNNDDDDRRFGNVAPKLRGQRE